jgi:hypothetical protein
MTRAASRRVAIWIDDLQAILLIFRAKPLDGSVLRGADSGWSQVQVDARQYAALQQYYDVVLSHLRPQDEILILGSGPAKRELRRQIEQQDGLKGKVVALYYATGLAKAELVFPTSEAWRSENTDQACVESLFLRTAPQFPRAPESQR